MSPTIDFLLLQILLSPITPAQRRELHTRLTEAANAAIGVACACPTCATVSSETNGSTTLADLSYLCEICGEGFDAEPIVAGIVADVRAELKGVVSR